MQQRITRNQQVFYLGLFMMLATAVASAATWPGADSRLTAVMLLGALISLAARIRHHLLRRSARRQNRFLDLAGYPLDLLRNPRFTSQRRAHS